MPPLIVKATFNGITRRLPLPVPSSLTDLYEVLKKHFPLPDDALASYVDEDGDTIAFTTNDELSALLDAAIHSEERFLRIGVVTPIPPAVTSNAEERLDALVDNLVDLISAIREDRSGLRVWSTPPREGPFVQFFTGLRPFFAMFPRRAGLRKSVLALHPVTRTEFNLSANLVRKSKQRQRLLKALSALTPAFRELMNDIPDVGVPDRDPVAVFVAAVDASLRPVDPEVVTKITQFIETASADPAFVDCLRKVRDVPLMPWEPGFVKATVPPRGFDVHQVSCQDCEKNPIVGSRFECAAEHLDLCADCHAKGTKTKGRTFKEYKFVWERSYPGKIVPPAPFRVGERGVKVKFLHKLLADLGFMNVSMFSRHPGLYTTVTKKAVAAFQAEKKIASASGVYDEPTAERLRQIIRERATAGDGDAANVGKSCQRW